jgi:hypothetical protein
MGNTVHSNSVFSIFGHFQKKTDEIRTDTESEGLVEKAPGCCTVALGSIPRPSNTKMGVMDEQPTVGPTKIRG